eukprot:CAMPEP_0197529958 /NCGR_PEP_ID=MMETSP1318-20131121/30243_1 /TAXON_ID=552666 /ORGANISM="Partenskyella glossopodia, Strain RCC365" /LENGTH=327 /DNA_ID=CAMNT_0043085605 /DNA_START=245 /DNA_END=1228 /DNA_ORIENTATION=+
MPTGGWSQARARALAPCALNAAILMSRGMFTKGRSKALSRKGRVWLCSATTASVGSSTLSDVVSPPASSTVARTYTYDHLFRPKEGDERLHDTALVLLNTAWNPTLTWLLGNVWDKVDVVVCADGASNRLYDLTQQLGAEHERKFVPSVLCGDLDSLKPHVAEYYKLKGVQIIQVDDDMSNDLEKCLKYVQEAHGSKHAILCGGLGGRFDHEMGNLNAMYKNIDKFSDVVLVGSNSLVQILGRGHHVIKVNRDYQGPHCGVIPIGGKTEQVKTKGLKWNLNGESLAFGGIVSSSNMLEDTKVAIDTSGPVIWTTSVCSDGACDLTAD